MSSPFASIVSRTREQINLGESGVRGLAQSLGIIVVAGVLLVGFALTASAFFTVGNIRNIFVQTTVLAVAAIGETIVMLTGGIDLSVGAIAFLGEVLVADLTTPLAAGATGVGLGAPPGGHSVLFALLVALAACGAMGLLNGLLVVVVGIPPILVTLATLYVATGWAEQVLNLRYIEVFKPIFAQFVTTNVLFDLPIMVAVGLGLYVVFAFVMKKTPFGRNVYAIGGNSRAARLSGLPVARVTVASYTIAGLLYGMAGFLTVCQLGMVSQSDLSTLNFQTIIVVLVGGLSISRGGVGRIERTLIGAAIFGMLTNYQTIEGVDPSFQQALLGGILLVAIVADRFLRGRS